MRRLFKYVISPVLAAIIAFSATAGVCAVPDSTGDIPIVYIAGQGNRIVSETGNPDSETIYPLNYTTEYISQAVSELNPIFAQALVTGDYTEYCNFICNAVEPVYAGIQLDCNGEPKDNSGTPWSWSKEDIAARASDGEFSLFDYEFFYDWRLDTYAIAKSLNSYITDVMEVTGAKQVNLVSRSLGCNIVAAYLDEFGNGDIGRCVNYCGVVDGADSCSKPFSGQITLDGDAVERYAYDVITQDELIYEFIKSSVSLLKDTYSLDVALAMVERIYGIVKEDITPRLLRMTYATFPSYWSMVEDVDYDIAKQFIYGNMLDEYSGLFEKTDRYRNNITKRAREMFAEIDESGTDVAIIAKYGYQIVPVTPNADEIADGIVELTLSSLGATTAQLDDTFSRRYMRRAADAGNDKYISPDKQVDCSTCALPESTWIIKGIEHRVFPESINELILTFLHHDGRMTIGSCEQYPQFLVYDSETSTISPMQEENTDTQLWNEDGVIAVLVRFMSQLFKVVKQYLIPLIKTELAPAFAG